MSENLPVNFDFSTEPRKDLVRYFEVLAKEIDRLLEECEGKGESLHLLDEFIKNDLTGNEELEKVFIDKFEAQEALNKLNDELSEKEKEFEIIKELFSNAMLEVKKRIYPISEQDNK